MVDTRSRVRAGQLVVAEAVLVAVVAAYAGPAWLFVGVLVAAAGIVVATFGRVDGRWWYEAALTYRRFARRRALVARNLVAATVSRSPTPPALAWLRTLAPGLVVRAVSVSGTGGDGAGVRVAVASDEAGWFGVVAVTDGPSVVPVTQLADLVEPPAGRGPALSGAQAVLRGDGRLGWLAVRLSAADAIELERGRGVAAVEALVCSGVRRAARALRERGYTAVALDPAGLLDALSEANQLEAPPQEHWAYWRAGGWVHAIFLAQNWPARLDLARLALSVSFATAAGGGWGVLIRVTARPGGLGAACRSLTRAATAAGVKLRRLDGEHGPAAYACSPTGYAADVLLDPFAAGRFPGRISASLGSASLRSASDQSAVVKGWGP